MDLHHDPAVRQPRRGDPDLGLRRGERRRVLQQLGEEVDEVGHGAAVDLRLRHTRHLDALVLLHLGGGGAQHVDQRDRLVPAAARLLAGEDQEVLAVAPHTGREVVQLEEVLQLVRVGLVVLQAGDQRQLALDEGLVAAREVGEDRVDVAPQQSLLGGEPDGLAVHLVEGAGDLADLVRGGDRDRLHPGVDLARVGPRQLVDEGGQPLLGHAEGGAAQLAHGAAHLPGHHRGDDERHQQGQDHRDTGDDRVALGVGGDLGRLLHRVLGEVGLDGAVQVEAGGGLRPPRLGGQTLGGQGLRGARRADHQADGLLAGGRRDIALAGGACLGSGLARLLLGLRLQLLLARDELPLVLLHTAGGVLLDRDALEVGVTAQRDPLFAEARRVRAGVDQQVHAERALERQGRLGQRDRVGGAPVGGDVAGAEAELVGELHQRVLDGDVALFGLDTLELLGVRRLTQRLQVRLDVAERVQPALETGLVRHRADGDVELLTGRVGGGAGLDDLAVVPLALEEGLGGDVALLDEAVAVVQRRLDDPRGLLRVLGLAPGVDGPRHLEAADHQADHDRQQKNGVEPRGYPPVARGETRAAPGGSGGLTRVLSGRRRSTLRRGEVTPRRRCGARRASPHSTNNLSAAAPGRGRRRLQARVLLGSSTHSSTSGGALPNSRGSRCGLCGASDKPGISDERRQKAGGTCAQRHGSTATRGGVDSIACRNVMNAAADRVQGHSPPLQGLHTTSFRLTLLEPGHQCVLDQGDECAFGVGAVACVGGDDGGVGADLECFAYFFGGVGLVSVEAVEGDDEGEAAVFEVVDGGEAVGEAAGVDEDDGADGAADEVVPHEPEAVLSGGAEEVEDEVLVEGDAAEVHGDGGGGLVAGVGEVVDAGGCAGHDGLGAQRVDLRYGSDERGLAHAEAARHHDFRAGGGAGRSAVRACEVH
ncbi:Spidroin-1 [Streptomyces sp. PVA_94-07]|nr:Spidroin-1 [Streptomyces sp. PVA_94-07]